MRDYRFIEYRIGPDGSIWHGPYSPEDNLHWKRLGSDIVTASEPPANSVEITPQQAALTMERRAHGLSA